MGLVIFPEHVINAPPEGLLESVKDSKALSHTRRLGALEIIRRHALFCGAVLVNHRLVDRLNVNGATAAALKRIVAESVPCPGAVIFDGSFKFDIGCELIGLVKGDSLSLSVAAASIAAKVHRDLVMDRLDERYPGYGFARHKGYGTEEHRGLIMKLGPCPIHRRSFEPVRSMARGPRL